jgi:hypothetical protein
MSCGTSVYGMPRFLAPFLRSDDDFAHGRFFAARRRAARHFSVLF